MTTRRKALKVIGAGVVGAGLVTPVTAQSEATPLKEQLALVRSATASYNDLENALADDFQPATPFICGEGRLYVKMSRVDGTFDLSRPEVLLYGEDEDGEPLLGAVAYLIPVPVHPARPNLFDDEDADLKVPEADGWHKADALGTTFWGLVVWVHTHNPEGVFHRTNPRKQFQKEGCAPPP